MQWQLAGFTVYIILKLWRSSVADQLKSEYMEFHHFSITCNNWNGIKKHLLFDRKNDACSSWLTLKIVNCLISWRIRSMLECNKQIIPKSFSDLGNVSTDEYRANWVSLSMICLKWGASRLEQTGFPHKHWLDPEVSGNNNCHPFFRSYCNFPLICWFNKWGLVSGIVKGVY